MGRPLGVGALWDIAMPEWEWGCVYDRNGPTPILNKGPNRPYSIRPYKGRSVKKTRRFFLDSAVFFNVVISGGREKRGGFAGNFRVFTDIIKLNSGKMGVFHGPPFSDGLSLWAGMPPSS